MKLDTEKVKSRLKDAIILLCHTDLHFASNVAVEGLLGITLDNKDIMLINIKETLKGEEEAGSASDPASGTAGHGTCITSGSVVDSFVKPYVLESSHISMSSPKSVGSMSPEVIAIQPISDTSPHQSQLSDIACSRPTYPNPKARRKRRKISSVSDHNVSRTSINKTDKKTVYISGDSDEDTEKVWTGRIPGDGDAAAVNIAPNEHFNSFPQSSSSTCTYVEPSLSLQIDEMNSINTDFNIKIEPEEMNLLSVEDDGEGYDSSQFVVPGVPEVVPTSLMWNRQARQQAASQDLNQATISRVDGTSVDQHTPQAMLIRTCVEKYKLTSMREKDKLQRIFTELQILFPRLRPTDWKWVQKKISVCLYNHRHYSKKKRMHSTEILPS